MKTITNCPNCGSTDIEKNHIHSYIGCNKCGYGADLDLWKEAIKQDNEEKGIK